MQKLYEVLTSNSDGQTVRCLDTFDLHEPDSGQWSETDNRPAEGPKNHASYLAADTGRNLREPAPAPLRVAGVGPIGARKQAA